MITNLHEAGETPDDIDEVLLTHWHPDHAGLASLIQRASDAPITIHIDDAPLVTAAGDGRAEIQARQREALRAWGVPREKRRTIDTLMRDETDLASVPNVRSIAGGDVIQTEGPSLRAHHTPGHTLGSVGFEAQCDGESMLFAGDTLLPGYTPNLGGADLRVEQPLERYLETLLDLHASRYDRLYPGHGAPLTEPNARIRETIIHHEQRTWRVLAALDREEPATPWELGGELFGDLSGYHAFIGPGEVAVHLEHLGARGLVARTPDGYRSTAAGTERLNDCTEERLALVTRTTDGDPKSVR